MTSRRPTARIFFIVMAVLIDMIAVGVIMPVLPALARLLPGIVALRLLRGLSQSNVAIAQTAVAPAIGSKLLAALMEGPKQY